MSAVRRGLSRRTLELDRGARCLARGIAGALQGAFKGRVSIRFAKEENFLRATWERAK